MDTSDIKDSYWRYSPATTSTKSHMLPGPKYGHKCLLRIHKTHGTKTADQWWGNCVSFLQWIWVSHFPSGEVSFVLQLALQNRAFLLHYWNCSASLRCKVYYRSERLRWAQILASWPLWSYSCKNPSDLFLWMSPKLQLSSSSSDPCKRHHLGGPFFFFFCLWNLMILKAKAVSLINNTPGTFLSSLHSHLPQKGRCNQLLGSGLTLVPILLDSISKPTKPLHSAKLTAQENFNFSRWKKGCRR